MRDGSDTERHGAPESGGARPSCECNGEMRTSFARTDAARRRFFQVWALIGLIAVIYVLGFVLNVLATPVAILVWTAVIVLCLRAPVAKLEALGVPRVAGSVIAYVGMFALLGVLGMVMFSPALGLGDQFASMAAGLPGYVQGLIDWGTGVYNQYASVLQNETVSSWIDSAAKSLTDWASAMAKLSADGVVGIGTGVANSFMVIGFSLVVAFWILMELPAIGREAMRLVPPSRVEEAQMIHLTFTRVMGGYLKATILQCLLIGVACGICFQIIGIPNAAALGLITGVMNIIPVVGPWIGGALAALVGLFVSPLAVVLALALTIAIQQFVYTFVSPKIMANSVDVHPALVIIALLCGSAVGAAMQGLVGSVVGMLLSIPLAAIAKSLFVFYFERRTGRQVVSADGVFFRGNPTHLDEEETRPDALSDAVGARRRPASPMPRPLGETSLSYPASCAPGGDERRGPGNSAASDALRTGFSQGLEKDASAAPSSCVASDVSDGSNLPASLNIGESAPSDAKASGDSES